MKPEGTHRRTASIAPNPTPEKARSTSDSELAAAELRQDFLYERLTPEQRQLVVEEALAIGEEAARNYRPRADEGMSAFAERLGCRVRFADDRNVVSNFLIRTEYRPRAAEILVYRGSVRQMLSVLRDSVPGRCWSTEVAEDIHVAHEVFHHLEATELGLVNDRLPKVVTFRWGPLVRRTSVRRAREISAHKYAKDILRLPFLPNLLDLPNPIPQT